MEKCLASRFTCCPIYRCFQLLSLTLLVLKPKYSLQTRPTSWASCQMSKIVGCACAGNSENVSPPQRVSNPDMHQGTCVTHVPWCMPGSLTNGFLSSRWQWKRSRYSRRMSNPSFYVSGKRPMAVDALASPVVWASIAMVLAVSLWSLTPKGVDFNYQHHPCDAKW